MFLIEVFSVVLHDDALSITVKSQTFCKKRDLKIVDWIDFNLLYYSKCLPDWNFNLLKNKRKLMYYENGAVLLMGTVPLIISSYENVNSYPWFWLVNPLSANPQNGQTHSNNSSEIRRRIVWVCLTILWNWHLKC